MRRLIFHGPHRLAVEESEQPIPGSGEVRVGVRAVGICGSDVHGYVGANDRRVPGMVMGHEAVGIVTRVGRGVVNPPVGTPVAINPAITCGICQYCQAGGQDNLCRDRRLYGCVLELPGAFAESIVVRAANVVSLEGPAPLEWGALVEPFAVGDHGVALASRLDDGVLVVGGGPIGLGAALAARRRGAMRVTVSEPQAHRRGVAEALGLETFDPSARSHDDEPYGAVIECVAAPETLHAALEMTAPAGEVILVGMGRPELPLPVGPLVVAERTIRGSFNYTRESFADVARWVMSRSVDLAPVIASRVDLDGLIEAFAGYAAGTRTQVKTVFVEE